MPELPPEFLDDPERVASLRVAARSLHSGPEYRPLRVVVSRRMGKGAGWDVLECGHKLRAPGRRVARRRRCEDCLKAGSYA